MAQTSLNRPASRPTSRPAIEALETRALMAVSFLNGVITVTGTNANDYVTVSVNSGSPLVFGDESVVVQQNNDAPFVRSLLRFVPGSPFGHWVRNVTRIEFEAGNGYNTLFNHTDIGSYARGGSGFDYFVGGSGDDDFHGLGANDILDGGGGDDDLNGGAGDDTCYGGAGEDYLTGDTYVYQTGQDVLYGGDDPDTLRGGPGNDKMYGGAGNDYLDDAVFYPGVEGGNDTLDGAAGDDTLLGHGGRDYMVGGIDDDSLNGGADDDSLWGMSGHDRLDGEGGDDFLDGRSGNDTLNGHSGNDTLLGDSGFDWLFGWSGNDDLDGGQDGLADVLWGGTDTDTFHADWVGFVNVDDPKDNVAGEVILP